MKVAIRRVSLASLGKFGCLLGAVAAFLPSLLCGLLGLGLASALRSWLEGWQKTSISIFGEEIAQLDLVRLLGLEEALRVLQMLGLTSAPVLFLAVVALALASGVLLALTIMLVGLAYNLLSSATGGLVVEMAAVDTQDPAQ